MIVYSHFSFQCFRSSYNQNYSDFAACVQTLSVAMTTQTVFQPEDIEGSQGSVSKRFLFLSCTDLSVGIFSCRIAARLHRRFNCCRTPEPVHKGDCTCGFLHFS